MREILFRGKDVRGRWYYGLLAHVNGGWYISNKAGIATAYEVREETIGQYTGLTDKNGKKIFEGDILEYRSLTGNGFEEVKNAVVFWDEHRWSYRTVYNNRWSNNWRGNERCDIYRHIVAEFGEVIGNIHDNPELLGGTGNEG